MSTAIATEFVTEEFETEISDETTDKIASTIEDIVRELRSRIISDDQLEALLRSDPGGNVLTSVVTTEQEDPEPLTQRAVIEPLFVALGYPDLSVETGDFSPEYGQQADYSVSLRDFDEIDSNRLLIEAEPLNKPLDQEKHGLGQVRDWLEKDKFEADFGIATDGFRWVLVKYDRDTYSFDTIAEVDLQPVFLAAFENVTGRQVSLDEWLGDSNQGVITEYARVFEWRNFRSIAGEARQVIKARKDAITDEFYDDYVRLVFGFREDEGEPAARSLIGDGIEAPEDASGDDVRLFAVELMNRLIFIKFLEDKGLVNETLLQDLREDHEDSFTPDSFYKTYLEPLFFGVLDERPNDRSERVRNIPLYSDVPYMDGGLFRPQEENGGDFDEEDFDVRDSVLTSIIDLLERYSFSADGGPTDLDPSVLGNVFEKTINHITTDSGDQQKELGAYYTPDEITSFCAEETVRPALQERFAERMNEEWGWTDEMADYDDVYTLIEALPENLDVIEDLLETVDHFRALDPACGSGHFLTSVQEEIVGIRKALYEKHPNDPSNWELYKQTVIQNVYGVDIVAPAVEIAKLRLWLSIIAEVDPATVGEYDEEELALPNVVFNVRQGNSLIGFTELMETTGDGDQAQLDSWGADSVRAKYGDIITQVKRHKQATDTETAMEHLERAEGLLEEYRDDLDAKVVDRFEEAGINNITLEQVKEFHPFHWVLEFASVYEDGGFSVITGNPPWDRLKPLRDDFFSRYDPIFRTRPPDEKDQMQEDLLSDEVIGAEWVEYQDEMEKRAEYFKNSPEYRLQRPEIDGRVKPNPNNLASLFFERVFELANNDSHVAQVLPGMVFNGASGKDLRTHLMENTRINILSLFENNGIFDQIHHQYKFGIVVFESEGSTEFVYGNYQEGNVDILNNFQEVAIKIPKSVLELYSPEARIFPYIGSEKKLRVLETIIKNPPLGNKTAPGGPMEPYQGLRRTGDSDRFVEESVGEYPVYGGKNVYQYTYTPDFYENIDPPEFWSVEEETNPEQSAKQRLREKTIGRLKSAIYEEFDGTGSQKSFVNELLEGHRGEPLSEDDVLLDCTEYRISFRRVARSTDERTLIATILPKGIVCHNTLLPVRNYRIEPYEEGLTETPLHDFYQRIFTDRELFTKVGILNSIPFDYLLRTKIDTDIATYKFKESQIPPITEGNYWFEYIWIRAARLNCYGDEFEEMRERLDGIEPVTDMDERKRLQAEIDAAAFHAYGLDREKTAFVLDDFHRVKNPRLMSDEYFDLVLEKYDALATSTSAR